MKKQLPKWLSALPILLVVCALISCRLSSEEVPKKTGEEIACYFSGPSQHGIFADDVTWRMDSVLFGDLDKVLPVLQAVYAVPSAFPSEVDERAKEKLAATEYIWMPTKIPDSWRLNGITYNFPFKNEESTSTMWCIYYATIDFDDPETGKPVPVEFEIYYRYNLYKTLESYKDDADYVQVENGFLYNHTPDSMRLYFDLAPGVGEISVYMMKTTSTQPEEYRCPPYEFIRNLADNFVKIPLKVETENAQTTTGAEKDPVDPAAPTKSTP